LQLQEYGNLTLARLLTLLVILLVSSVATLHAQKLFGEYAFIDIPDEKNYYQAWLDKSNDQLIVEFVPKGQTYQNWQELFSLFRDYNNIRTSPRKYAEILIAREKRNCVGCAGRVEKNGALNGYAFSLYTLSHPEPTLTTKRPEWNLALAIKGKDALYVFSKSWGYEPRKSEIAEWTSILLKTDMCDTRIPKKACPSKYDIVYEK
jgi:hypothetical protein